MTDERAWIAEYIEAFAAARGFVLPPSAPALFARYAAFLLEQIGNAQGVPRNIILERIHATRRVSRLNAKR